MERSRKPAERPSPRPYRLGQRQETLDQNRASIVAAAREVLSERNGPEFSMEQVARRAGVTRQTIHNQFGNRAGLLEAVFDLLALEGGMKNMPIVMQQSDPDTMLRKFVELFANFWTRHRTTLRRVHALAGVDPEFATTLGERNLRRRLASRRVAQVHGKPATSDLLYALTSFEFFDLLAGEHSPDEMTAQILHMAKCAFE